MFKSGITKKEAKWLSNYAEKNKDRVEFVSVKSVKTKRKKKHSK